MMKCAMDMIEITREIRERAAVEAEKRRKEEQRKLQILTTKNTEKFAEKIFTEFEKVFKTFTGDPKYFRFTYRTDYGHRIGFYDKHTIYKVYVSGKRAYRDGGDSYDFDTSTIINIDYLKEIFEKLCYKLDIGYYCDNDIRYFGCGAIKLIAISITLDPACLEG